MSQNSQAVTEVGMATGDLADEHGHGDKGITDAAVKDNQLHQAIRRVMLDRETPAFDKRRAVVALVRKALENMGHFFRTLDSRLFFFVKPERALYDLEQRGFQHLLTNVSNLSATESGFRFVLDMLQATMARTAPLVDIHTLAHYVPATGLLAVSDGAQGIWLRERDGEWTYTYNGDNGLLFLTDPEATAWVPDFAANGHALKSYLEGFLFIDGVLTGDEQRVVLLIYLLHQMFPALRRTRTIPAFLGPQGSGKTSAERRVGSLFVGSAFDVTGLHRDREDGFVAAVTNRTVVGLDNADARIPWLEDALATYATGLRYRLRRLYTTNEEVSYGPRALLMISSRDPQFARPDVAERLLPFHCGRPEQYLPEARLRSELDRGRGAVMASLLTRAAQVADALPRLDLPAVGFRMADLGSFGWAAFEATTGRGNDWLAVVKKLEGAQAAFASDGDGLIEAIRVLLNRHAGKLGPLAVAEFYREASEVAEHQSLPFPKNTIAFGRRLSLARRVLEVELGVRVHEERGHGGQRYVTLVPRGEGGGDGEGVGGNPSKKEVGR